jgi:hypothetical protein
MKFKYIKEFKNFNKHPEDNEAVRKVINKEEDDKKVSREEMETVLLKVPSIEQVDLDAMSDDEIKDMFLGTIEDISDDERDEKKIDPDLRN